MTPMSDSIFVDSNLWLYAFVLRPGEESKHTRALPLVEAMNRYTISTQVVSEVSSNLLRKAGMAENEVLDIVEGFYRRCRIINTGLECHRTASRLRSVYQLSFWDSLIVAAALEAGCNVLHSEDMQHGQVIDKKLTILNPFLEQPTP
jgi:predicted nucleic acid-binding protein